MNPLSLLLGGIAGLGEVGYGLYQTIHGNHKLNNLERPTYNVDPNIVYNKNLAAQNASEGIPDSAKNFYADSIERGLGTTANAAMQTGQGLGAINNAYQSSTDAFRQLMAADAMQKQQNQQVLMGANKDLAEENLRAFDYNKNIPYQQLYNRYTQQSNSGAQNIFGGLNQLGSMATGFGGFGGGNKTSNPNGGGTDWSSNYGGQGGFQSYQNQPSPNFGQYNYMYGLPNYGWHP